MMTDAAFISVDMRRVRAHVLWGAIAPLLLVGASSHAQSIGCLIEPHQVAEVGTHVAGVVERIDVERGDAVKKGQVVALLKAEVERAAVGVAVSRAQAQAEVQAAVSAHEFARRKLARTEDLHQKNFLSAAAKDQAATEAAVAEMKLAQAREQQRLAERELGLASAQLSQRTIRSPIDGVIVERYLGAGERVEDKPLLKVATVDPLRVELIVPAAHFNKLRSGMSGRIRPELPGAAEYVAQVSLVDRVIDAASNTFRVRLALPNPNGEIPAGLRCRADLGLEPAVPTAAPTPLPPAPKQASLADARPR